MRVLAVVLLVLAALLAASSVRDQNRGIAEAVGAKGIQATAVKAKDPEAFRALMAYEWIRVTVCAGGGVIFWHLANRSRQLDPFTPDAR